MKAINIYLEQIKSICKKHKIKKLFAFGSVITSNFNSESDVDFLVEIEDENPHSYSEKYFALEHDLKILLNKNIDLIDSKVVSNVYFKNELDRTKILIYEI